MECNLEKEQKGANLADYVGESSRSLHERSKEHNRDYAKNSDDSHMYKHFTNTHPGNTRPRFAQRVVIMG